MPRVIIIADDLTGALDAAAPFANRGLRTRVVNCGAALDAAMAEDCEVLSVNTRSRHCSAAEAATYASAATATAIAARPEVLFKKIDSTLRGNVAVEIAAASRIAGRHVLVCPAVPAQGRTVRDGQVLVHGLPLAASSAGQDARSAPPDRPLTELLSQCRPGIRRSSAASLSADDVGDLVVDADTNIELQRLALTVNDRMDRWLLVGAAGLAEAVAEIRFGPPQTFTGFSRAAATVAMVVGSRSPESAAQIDRLQQIRSDYRRLQVLSSRLAEPTARGHALIFPGSPPSGARRFSSDEVARRMAAAACCWLDAATAPGMLMTGGDTALAISDGLGCTVMDVHGELEAGVVCASLPLAGDRVPVITKAGGFGDCDLLLRAHDSLEAGHVLARPPVRDTRGPDHIRR